MHAADRLNMRSAEITECQKHEVEGAGSQKNQVRRTSQGKDSRRDSQQQGTVRRGRGQGAGLDPRGGVGGRGQEGTCKEV